MTIESLAQAYSIYEKGVACQLCFLRLLYEQSYQAI